MASVAGNAGGSTANSQPGSGGSQVELSVDLAKRIVLPLKEYEQELKEEESNPGLLYDYSSMTAWLFHPVKRMKLKDGAHSGSGERSDGGDSGADPNLGGTMANGRLLNGGLMV